MQKGWGEGDSAPANPTHGVPTNQNGKGVMYFQQTDKSARPQISSPSDASGIGNETADSATTVKNAAQKATENDSKNADLMNQMADMFQSYGEKSNGSLQDIIHIVSNQQAIMTSLQSQINNLAQRQSGMQG